MKGSAGVLATAAWFPTASGPQGKEEGFLFFLAVDKHMNGVINCCSIFGPDVYDDKPLASAFLVRRYDTTGIKKTQPAKERKTEKKKQQQSRRHIGGPSSQIGTQAQGTSSSHLGFTGTRLGLGKGLDDTKHWRFLLHTIGKRDLH